MLPVRTESEMVRLKKIKNAWDDFRKESVTEHVRDIYKLVKSENPSISVSAAVKWNKEESEKALQDWPGWLKKGYMDFVVTMCYGDDEMVRTAMARNAGILSSTRPPTHDGATAANEATWRPTPAQPRWFGGPRKCWTRA